MARTRRRAVAAAPDPVLGDPAYMQVLRQLAYADANDDADFGQSSTRLRGDRDVRLGDIGRQRRYAQEDAARSNEASKLNRVEDARNIGRSFGSRGFLNGSTDQMGTLGRASQRSDMADAARQTALQRALESYGLAEQDTNQGYTRTLEDLNTGLARGRQGRNMQRSAAYTDAFARRKAITEAEAAQRAKDNPPPMERLPDLSRGATLYDESNRSNYDAFGRTPDIFGRRASTTQDDVDAGFKRLRSWSDVVEQRRASDTIRPTPRRSALSRLGSTISRYRGGVR